MNRMIQVEKIAFGSEVAGLEHEWEQLLLNSVRPSIFLTFDFVYTSCTHFRNDAKIFFLLFRDADTRNLLAIFPLSRWVRKSYGIELEVISHGVNPQTSEVDKPRPIIDRNHEAECWMRFRDYFLHECRSWDVIDFEELIANSYLPKNLAQLFPFPRFWTKVKAGPDSPMIRLDGEWEEFWGKHRKLRKKCRRLERALGDNLSYRITNDPADAEQCLKEYIETEIGSWKEGEMVAKNRAFYEELFLRLAENRQLYFGMMYDGEAIVSIEVAYAFQDQIYFCHGTYSSDYAALSPGAVNSCWFIRYFHGKGFVEGDYLAGFSDYNKPWAARIERTANVIVRRMGWKNWCLAGFHLGKKIKIKLNRVVGKRPKNSQAKRPQNLKRNRNELCFH